MKDFLLSQVECESENNLSSRLTFCSLFFSLSLSLRVVLF
jgi:hypothetical protein